MKPKILCATLLALCLPLSAAWAHGGHIHAPSITRGSHPYLQKCVPQYLKLQAALAAGRLDGQTKRAAGEMAEQARGGALEESEASGRSMLMDVFKGGKAIAAAQDLEGAREAFAGINKSVLPFFIIWTSHLKEHGLRLFYCADAEALAKRDKIDFTKGWMQKEDTPQNPYGGELCPDLQVEKGEK